MQGHQNIIKLEGNGNIVIQDVKNGSVTINTLDMNDILLKLNQLNENQITILKEFCEEQNNKLSDLFINLLSKASPVKNVVNGDISNNQEVIIGDITHIHNHIPITKIPKLLTAEIPTRDSKEIVGRKSVIEELRQLLFHNKQVVVLNGLGGIGKTTVAQVYVNELFDCYKHIAWITQVSNDIIFDFVKSKELIRNLSIGNEYSKPKEIFKEIMRQLKMLEQKPNLMVLDNANFSLDQLLNILPKQPDWHILITSRQELNNFNLKHLDFLSREEALLLFKKYCNRIDFTDEQIEELISPIEYHTLTVELLAKIAEKQGYNFNGLKQAIKKNLRAMVQTINTDKIEMITTYLSSIFNLSILNFNELWLMKQFACLPTDFHSYTDLTSLIKKPVSNKIIFDRLKKKRNDEFNLSETLYELTKKGWLQKNDKTQSYIMHRIISEITLIQLKPNYTDFKELIESITELLGLQNSFDNPVFKLKWIKYGDVIKDTISGFENKLLMFRT